MTREADNAPQVAYGTNKLFGAEPPERPALRELAEAARMLCLDVEALRVGFRFFPPASLGKVREALAAAERALARGEG